MENKGKAGSSLTANIIKVLSANLWVTIIGFLGGFVFPKILTIDAYAEYHTFTLYLKYIAIIHLGFPSGMMIRYAGQDYEKIDKKRYKSELIILLSILSFFSIVFLAISIINSNKMMLYIAIAAIPTGINGSYKSLLQSWSRFKFYSRMNTFISTTVPVLALAYYFITKSLPGDVYIAIYLLIDWIMTIYIMIEMVKKVHGVKSYKVISKENLQTEKTGIVLVAGNYINTLFTSADKQFIKIFFENTQFAFYSFGMSMQSLMTVFITSVAQPLFPAMAKGHFTEREYVDVRKMLMVFGSLSGCAYFAASIVVKMFIQKYTPSLDVVSIYFVVFPAMAVINGLYINLFKIKNRMKDYIFTLAAVLCVAICLNLLFVHIWPDYTGVAVATVLTYYIWFFLGARQFKFLEVGLKDIIYLSIFTFGFFSITRSLNDWIGLVVFFLFDIIIALLFYREVVMKYTQKILKGKLKI